MPVSRVGVVLAMIALVVISSARSYGKPDVPLADGTMCTFWYAIGSEPTSQEITSAASRYKIVVLNAWELDAMHQLRELNPAIHILVYKDLASTRSYPGALDNGVDATLLPTGVGYAATNRAHPDWFAVDNEGKRIEWSKAYRDHWQMAVWDPAYQQQWVSNVTAEVIRDGWDGVLADNDMAYLRFYSDQLVEGTHTRAESDQKIRNGLDRMIDLAGNSLAAAGKFLVPNISERKSFPERWDSASRFGGGMDEPSMQIESDALCR
jgi:hypothetical protein